MPIFQLPDDVFLDWPIDLNFGGGVDYLGKVNE